MVRVYFLSHSFAKMATTFQDDYNFGNFKTLEYHCPGQNR